MRPAAVYRHINADGATIYIGCSVNPIQRTATHTSASPWIRDVASISIEWFDTIEAALAAEAALIEAESPIHNTKHCRTNSRRNVLAPKLLAEWMDAEGVSVHALATRLGVTAERAARLTDVRGMPRLGLRDAIAKVTNGAVPHDAWRVVIGRTASQIRGAVPVSVWAREGGAAA